MFFTFYKRSNVHKLKKRKQGRDEYANIIWKSENDFMHTKCLTGQFNRKKKRTLVV
jgi:hypothetical protein